MMARFETVLPFITSFTLSLTRSQHGTTPMAIYGMIKKHKIANPEIDVEQMSPDDIEAKYAGTGLGRKNLEEICREIGINSESALDRLSLVEISASGEDNARDIAEKHDRSPIDLLVIMMQP